MSRTLVAGFGNVLRGDDGFGVEVVRRLEPRLERRPDGPPPGVELLDVGTGGIRLAQELCGGYDRLIVVDAMQRGGAPGTVYVLAVDALAEAAEAIDAHLAVPSSALALARALGVLPSEVVMVGCEPEPCTLDELTLALSPRAAAAADEAVDAIVQLLRRPMPNASTSHA